MRYPVSKAAAASNGITRVILISDSFKLLIKLKYITCKSAQ